MAFSGSAIYGCGYNFEVVRGPVGVVWGRFWAGLGPKGPQAGHKSAPNDSRPDLGPQQKCSHMIYLQSLRQFKFCFALDQEMATKWPYNWSPGIILGAFCTIFRA